MSRRLFFTGGVPADVDNRFTPGSGVGGRSRAVRRALVRRVANSTCCQPGGGKRWPWCTGWWYSTSYF